MQQTTLQQWAESQREPRAHNTIREAWEQFHASHPEVFEAFERFALDAIAAGQAKLGAKAVWERVRWHTQVGSGRRDGTKFDLNNNFTAYYARLFMARHPHHGRVFATRKVRS